MFIVGRGRWMTFQRPVSLKQFKSVNFIIAWKYNFVEEAIQIKKLKWLILSFNTCSYTFEMKIPLHFLSHDSCQIFGIISTILMNLVMFFGISIKLRLENSNYFLNIKPYKVTWHLESVVSLALINAFEVLY